MGRPGVDIGQMADPSWRLDRSGHLVDQCDVSMSDDLTRGLCDPRNPGTVAEALPDDCFERLREVGSRRAGRRILVCERAPKLRKLSESFGVARLTTASSTL
jgi:hypothetical protein